MKNITLKIMAVILSALMLASLLACNTPSESETDLPTDAPTDAPTEKATKKPTNKDFAPAKTYPISNDSEYVKIIGRSIDLDIGGVSCDFSASGIEFQGVMGGKVTIELQCTADTYFTVFIDGERQEKRISAGTWSSNIRVANFETEGQHHIRVQKQTNSTAPCTLRSITVNGYLEDAPADREYLIEFLGDSITCGYGNLGDTTTGSEAGTAKYTDGTQTYAFYATEKLSADISALGCSGVGIDQGWTSFPVRDFMDKASYYRDNQLVYEDNSRVPDIVVINLGTNDKSRGSTEENFKKGVREIIEYFRGFYQTDMPIVWVYGMMNDGCIEWTRAVLEELGGEAAGLYSVELMHNNTGGNGHPNYRAQGLAGQQLVDFIKEKGLLPEKDT